MEERDWLILKTLYKYKNITRAAEELFLTQPALTSRLKYIESIFGVQIVTRNTKGVKFTAQGEYLAEKSRELLNDFVEIRNQVLSLSANTEGTINIAASSYITNYRLPQLLKEFKRVYPSVDVNVATVWSKDVFRHVFTNDVHVGFASIADIDTVERHLLSEENVCIVSREDFELACLYKYPRINYQSNYLLRSQVDRWWREDYKQAPKTIVTVDKLPTCIEMVKAGLGYAIIPVGAVKELEDIKIEPIRDRLGQCVSFKIWMLYHKEVLSSNIARVFIEFVTKQNIII